MHKTLFSANGNITFPLQASSSVVIVNYELYNYLSSMLGEGDWGYLKIQDDISTEIVKIFALLSGNRLAVLRGIDYTTPSVFYIGALISYVDTQAAVLDEVVISTLQLTAQDGIQVEKYVVTYDINIKELGGTEVIGEDGVFVLARNEEAYKCCGIKDLPPEIPFEYTMKARITGYGDIRVTGDGDYRVVE